MLDGQINAQEADESTEETTEEETTEDELAEAAAGSHCDKKGNCGGNDVLVNISFDVVIDESGEGAPEISIGATQEE